MNLKKGLESFKSFIRYYISRLLPLCKEILEIFLDDSLILYRVLIFSLMMVCIVFNVSFTVSAWEVEIYSIDPSSY